MRGDFSPASPLLRISMAAMPAVLPGLQTFSEEDRTKAAEAMQLLKEANRMLNQLDETYHVHTIFRLCKANADGD